MSEAKFTKGEWEYDKELEGIYNTVCNFICDAPKNNKYDAHLIAAAPEMYEMLKKIQFEHCNCSKLYNEIDELREKARGEHND